MQRSETICLERVQLAYDRTIRIISIFPKQPTKIPEDKLKALIDRETWGIVQRVR